MGDPPVLAVAVAIGRAAQARLALTLRPRSPSGRRRRRASHPETPRDSRWQLQRGRDPPVAAGALVVPSTMVPGTLGERTPTCSGTSVPRASFCRPPLSAVIVDVVG